MDHADEPSSGSPRQAYVATGELLTSPRLFRNTVTSEKQMSARSYEVERERVRRKDKEFTEKNTLYSEPYDNGGLKTAVLRDRDTSKELYGALKFAHHTERERIRSARRRNERKLYPFSLFFFFNCPSLPHLLPIFCLTLLPIETTLNQGSFGVWNPPMLPSWRKQNKKMWVGKNRFAPEAKQSERSSFPPLSILEPYSDVDKSKAPRSSTDTEARRRLRKKGLRKNKTKERTSRSQSDRIGKSSRIYPKTLASIATGVLDLAALRPVEPPKDEWMKASLSMESLDTSLGKTDEFIQEGVLPKHQHRSGRTARTRKSSTGRKHSPVRKGKGDTSVVPQLALNSVGSNNDFEQTTARNLLVHLNIYSPRRQVVAV